MPEKSRETGEPSTHDRPESYNVDEIRQKYPNAYEKWSSEEDRRLKEGYDAGMSMPNLAKHFGRQNGAIRARLKKLGIYRKMSSQKAFADSSDKLSQLAEEALMEHRQGQTRVLDPEKL